MTSSIYPKSFANNGWYSTSSAEPIAITKNLASSASEFRPQPSAIFEVIENNDLRICEVNHYSSSLGNSLVSLYISNTSVWLRTQICKVLKSTIIYYFEYNHIHLIKLIKSYETSLWETDNTRTFYLKPNT